MSQYTINNLVIVVFTPVYRLNLDSYTGSGYGHTTDMRGRRPTSTHTRTKATSAYIGDVAPSSRIFVVVNKMSKAYINLSQPDDFSGHGIVAVHQ